MNLSFLPLSLLSSSCGKDGSPEISPEIGVGWEGEMSSGNDGRGRDTLPGAFVNPIITWQLFLEIHTGLLLTKHSTVRLIVLLCFIYPLIIIYGAPTSTQAVFKACGDMILTKRDKIFILTDLTHQMGK